MMRRLARYWPVLLLALPAVAQTVKIPLRYATPPTTFYQASNGSDNNKCTQALPCLTVAHTIAYALAFYDAQGNDLTIDIGAGQTITDGIIIGGALPGAAGGSTVGGSLRLIGHGSGTTIINNTSCTGTTAGLSVGGGAYVQVGSMTVKTTCSGGSAVSVQQSSTVRLADADFAIGPASYAQVFVYGHSIFTGNSTYRLALSGNATFAFAGSSYGMIILSGGAVNTITGTPAYSAFVDLIDNSFFDIGLGSSFSGSATGTRYSANLNSSIDMEDVTTALPGDAQGNVSNGSFIFNNTGNLGACVGGATLCPVATAPTGLGDGTAAMSTGSGDTGGSVVMTAGAAAAAAGVIHVSTPSIVAGPGHQGGFCAAQIRTQGTGTWDPRATVFQDYIAGNLTLTWDNNSVALSNGSTYDISYVCQ